MFLKSIPLKQRIYKGGKTVAHEFNRKEKFFEEYC